MLAEDPNPSSVPDVPEPPEGPDLPEIPADPTWPGTDPEPQDMLSGLPAALFAMGAFLAPIAASAQSQATSAHGLFGVRWTWIAIGVVVLAVLSGLVAMSGNRSARTTAVRRE